MPFDLHAPLSELDRKIEALRAKRKAEIDDAIATERERCAKICESLIEDDPDGPDSACYRRCAAAIRNEG